jgi:hypothetical protein
VLTLTLSVWYDSLSLGECLNRSWTTSSPLNPVQDSLRLVGRGAAVDGLGEQQCLAVECPGEQNDAAKVKAALVTAHCSRQLSLINTSSSLKVDDSRSPTSCSLSRTLSWKAGAADPPALPRCAPLVRTTLLSSLLLYTHLRHIAVLSPVRSLSCVHAVDSHPLLTADSRLILEVLNLCSLVWWAQSYVVKIKMIEPLNNDIVI